MGCSSCANGSNGKPAGCKSNGFCASGACNKLNTYNWLNDLPLAGEEPFDIVEISFNSGSRKDFYRKKKGMVYDTGDLVVVEAKFGYDIGQITLSGELVKIQMKKKRVRDSRNIGYIIRKAHERDLDKYERALGLEKSTMLKSRVIARNLGLEMKIGDVEYQKDLKKATFYYTADDRVDFRDLIKEYAREFKIKVEMRQIGARQEAGKIGGIGSCGRELCCSTWLTDFSSVSTSAARYQNLAINQAKLSGQCGRLKCCLNYELDTYLEALQEFPDEADKLYTEAGTAYLQKTDIFGRLMFYSFPGKMKYFKLSIQEVVGILEMNKKGEKPETLQQSEEPERKIDYEDTIGHISLDLLDNKTKSKKKKRRKGKRRKGGGNNGNQNRNQQK